ncbi:ROK family protein, partial [Gammaproteobacteria bacterium]|nr:ROK family protein [Gammaproteobacteria bacterium]
MRIGIDLGGTKIEGIVLRNDGEIIHKLRVPTRGDYYEIILDDLTALIQSF